LLRRRSPEEQHGVGPTNLRARARPPDVLVVVVAAHERPAETATGQRRTDREHTPEPGVNALGGSNVARGDVEGDLRLALEKCEQMLARLRAPQHASRGARDRDALRVDENTEQLLEDLSPRARLVPPLTVAEVDRGRRAIVLSLENARRPAAESASLEGAESATPGAGQTTEEANPGEGHLLFVPTTTGYRLVERNGPAPPDGDRVELPEQGATFRVAKLGASPLPHDTRVCAYLDRPSSAYPTAPT
jgi:hypothetical protein